MMRKTLLYIIIALLFLTNCTTKIEKVKTDSVNGSIQTLVAINNQKELTYSISEGKNNLILNSPLGLNIDSINIGEGIEVIGVEKESKDETYPWIGNQNTIHNLYNESKIELRHIASNRKYFLEIRAYNNGVAFRYIVPSEGITTVYSEYTTFTVPDKSKVWYARGPFSYGWLQEFQERDATQIEGELLAPPATFQLAGNKGYIAISEAGLYNFHGAVLFGKSPNTVKIGFVDNEGHIKTGKKMGIPEYKYAHSAIRDICWKQENDIVTPWRVVMFGKDLNELVNNNIVALVNPAPDTDLFPDGLNTNWIKPGRSLWTWLAERHQEVKSSPELYLQYIDYASDLNIEYLTIDEGWYRWKDNGKTNWDIVRDITEASKKKSVGIWLWKSGSERKGVPGFDNEKFRKEFMQKCKELGVVGLKVDFFQTENKFTVDLMENILIDAAKNQLMIVFHGVNKPTGECRTYPNMMAKEAVRGLENVGGKYPGLPWPKHNTVLPFTRLLAGPADYTPLHFGRWKPGSTTVTHQIASPFIFTSPMLFFAADPEDFYESKAKDILTNISVQWDETIVLPESKIGEVAVFVRRKGDNTYLIVLNGQKGKTLDISLDFIKQGKYNAVIVRDDTNGEQIHVDAKEINTSDPVHIDLLPGGGYLMKINGVL